MSTHKSFCVYHQLHQPFRINHVENHEDATYEDFFQGPNPGKHGNNYSNEQIYNQVAQSSYIPATEYWLGLLRKYPELKLTLSLSGTFLEQSIQYNQLGGKVIANLQRLLATGRVEFLGETYYHSLSFLYDIEEYLEQIQKHRNLIKEIFDYEPVSFRNTELIYHAHLAEIIRQLGYKTILASKADPVNGELGFSSGLASRYTIDEAELRLIKRYRIAEPVDQIAVLLNEEKVAMGLFVLENIDEAKRLIFESDLNLINFFTDFEIYGEHNKDLENGILQVVDGIIGECIKQGMSIDFVTEAGQKFKDNEYKSEEFTTWANVQNDLRTWVGQDNQNRAHRKMTVLLTLIKNLDPRYTDEYDPILEMWRKLSTSDHFYYMPFHDSPREQMALDLFSPYESPQTAYDQFVAACDFLTRKIIQANLDASKNTMPIAHHSHNIYS